MMDAPGDRSLGIPRWARQVLVLGALAVVPAILSLISLAAKTPGLVLGPALEAAQVARHVAAGEGLVTDSIRPLSLAVQPSLQHHPDLYQAPLHPLLLGVVFRLLHASDRVDAGLGLGLWTVSILLTFGLARRWFGPGVALVATALYGSNVAMLKGAAFGLGCPLGAIGMLAASWLAVPEARAAGLPAAPEKGADARLVGAGLVAGLLFLFHYLLLFLVPAIAAGQIGFRRRRGRAAGLFAAGFLAVAVPWMIRNVVWARSPFFSLYWYEALAGTDSYPGDTVWRTLAAAKTGPWEFGFLHPLEMFRKMLSGLMRFWQEGLSITDPVVAVLAGAALLGGPKEAWRGWLRLLALAAGLTIAASCTFRAEPEILLAWTPMLAIAAAVQLSEGLEARAQALDLRRAWSTWAAPLFRNPARLRTTLRRAGEIAVLGIVAVPMVHYLFVYRAEGRSTAWVAEPLGRLLPAEAVVMTDLPAAVAWAGHRHAVWLCLAEAEWDQIEAHGGRIDATYVSPSIAANPSAPGVGWWAWVASPHGVYRNLAPVDAAPLPGAFRRRAAVKG